MYIKVHKNDFSSKMHKIDQIYPKKVLKCGNNQYYDKRLKYSYSG